MYRIVSGQEHIGKIDFCMLPKRLLHLEFGINVGLLKFYPINLNWKTDEDRKWLIAKLEYKLLAFANHNEKLVSFDQYNSVFNKITNIMVMRDPYYG